MQAWPSWVLRSGYLLHSPAVQVQSRADVLSEDRRGMIFIQVPMVWSRMWFLEGYHIEGPSFQDVSWKQPLIFSHVSFTTVAARFLEASKRESPHRTDFSFTVCNHTHHPIPFAMFCWFKASHRSRPQSQGGNPTRKSTPGDEGHGGHPRICPPTVTRLGDATDKSKI